VRSLVDCGDSSPYLEVFLLEVLTGFESESSDEERLVIFSSTLTALPMLPVVPPIFNSQ
jgi:hypothetical protein